MISLIIWGAIAIVAMKGILCVRRLQRSVKANECALAATYYHCDMGKLFLELIDDPFMTSAKWREWLPLFEDADRCYAETHPYLKNFFHYAEAVRREITDLPLQEIGSP